MNDPMTHFDWLPGNSQILDVEGVRLETICFGPPPEQAATLILLHEGLGCVALWRAFPEALAEATGLGVFAYSRAGYGQSDPCSLPRPLDYMEREARDSLPRVLDAIGFRQGLLLGHSDGASIAALHGGFGDDLRVRGLVLMAPHFFTEPEGLAAIADARSQYQSGELRNRLGKYHADVDCAFLGWNDAAFALDGFYEYRCGPRAHVLNHGVDVIQLGILKALGKGVETFLYFLLPRCGQRA